LLAQCAQQFPHIRPVLHDQVQRLNVDSVRSGEVDFGIVVEPGVVDDLECQPLLDDGFWLICRDDHPLAALSGAMAATGRLPLVLLDYSSGSRPVIDRILASQGVHCPVAQQLGHSSSVFQMVQAGIGISVSPGLALPLPAGAS
jgi:DNA-binding transcriptional LysR family regulator